MSQHSYPFLFLPGMMCDHRVFTPQIDFITTKLSAKYGVAELLSDNTVATLASLGFDALDILQKQFSSPTKVILCGLSMGGIVAMEMLKVLERSQNQYDIAGVILMDTNYLNEIAEKQEKRDLQLARVKNGEFNQIIKEDMKPFYLKENQGAKAMELWQLFFDMAKTLGETTFINQTLALRNRPNYESVLQTLSLPTLIICGEHDALCPVERHKQMAKLVKKSTLRIVPAAGHIANLEQPKLVNQMISEWVQQQGWA